MARDTRGRDDGGRFADGIDPETVLDVFDAREDLARPITATDVVDELGIARRTAHNKLNALVERGVLETRKIGARGRVWWTPIDAQPTPDSRDDDAETADSRPETDADRDETHTSGAGPAADEGAHDADELDETLSDRAADVVDEIDAEYGLDEATVSTGSDAETPSFIYTSTYGDTRASGFVNHSWRTSSTPTAFRPATLYLRRFGKTGVTGSGDRPNLLASFPGVEQRGNGYVFERELVDA